MFLWRLIERAARKWKKRTFCFGKMKNRKFSPPKSSLFFHRRKPKVMFLFRLSARNCSRILRPRYWSVELKSVIDMARLKSTLLVVLLNWWLSITRRKALNWSSSDCTPTHREISSLDALIHGVELPSLVHCFVRAVIYFSLENVNDAGESFGKLKNLMISRESESRNDCCVSSSSPQIIAGVRHSLQPQQFPGPQKRDSINFPFHMFISHKRDR